MRLLVLIPCLAVPLAGQVGPTDRLLCDPGAPVAACPATPCNCTEDRLEIVFDEVGASVLEMDAPSPGMSVSMSVILEARSPKVQGWSYGVAHDSESIQLESVAFEGTDAARQYQNGFEITTFEDVLSCEKVTGRVCEGEEPGGGYIAACVLALHPNVFLDPGRNSVSKATYKLLEASAEAMPIQIALAEHLKKGAAPPVAINVTSEGRSVRPSIVADGWIIAAERSLFHRGDPDTDGRVSVLDAMSLLLFLFISGPAPSCLEAGDFDDDGRIDGTDPISILRWLFLDGSSPASPGPPGLECGVDPEGSPSRLGCAAYPPC